MKHGSAHLAELAGIESALPSTAEDGSGLASGHLRASRRIQVLAILGGIPLVFASWIVVARVLDVDVIFTARAAMLCAVPLVCVAIFAPLFLPYPREVRWRGYILQWFYLALFFNAVWQVPPVLFPSAFKGVEHTHGALPYYIFWWGYHSADLDYGAMTPFWVLAEVSWWVIVIPIVAALVQLRRGREAQALALFCVCGALQVYNVAFFIGYGGIVERFANIATDSPIAPVLYWVLNLLWGLAGGIASVLSFRCLFPTGTQRGGA